MDRCINKVDYCFVQAPVIIHKDGYIKFRKDVETNNISFPDSLEELKNINDFKNDFIIDYCFYIDRGGKIEYISFSDGSKALNKVGIVEQVKVDKELSETEKTILDCYLQGSGMFIYADEKGKTYLRIRG